eukprot:Filipodium_phascolosomae@DN3726_c0_g1_i1.p1
MEGSVFVLDSWTPGCGGRLARQYQWLIISLTALYGPIIYGLQRYMKNRPPMNLKWAAFSWNITLSILSGIGAVVLLIDNPWQHSLMYLKELEFVPTRRLVTVIFALTKCVEYGDTLFLVLKKRPVIFLHFYHHVTVALFCMYAQMRDVGFCHNFALFNVIVHTIMYFYYALTCIYRRNKILGFFRPYITIIQLVQMFYGMGFSMAAYFYVPEHEKYVTKLSIGLYLSYALLFAHFYVKNYWSSWRPVVTVTFGFLYMLAGLTVAALVVSFSLPLIIVVTVLFFLTQLVSNSVRSKYLRQEASEKVDFSTKLCLMVLNCFVYWGVDQVQYRSSLRGEAASTLANDGVSTTRNEGQTQDKALNKKASFPPTTVAACARKLANLADEKTHSERMMRECAADLWLSSLSLVIPVVLAATMFPANMWCALCSLSVLRWVVEIHFDKSSGHSVAHYKIRDDGDVAGEVATATSTRSQSCEGPRLRRD